MGKAKRSSPSWPAEFSQDFCKNSITLLPRHQYKHLTHNWSYLNTSLKLPFKTLLWFCSCMVISRLITTVSWGPNCPSFNLHHVTLSMWQLMWSMTSPLNIQASSGLLQLFPTIQLPPCSTKELKTHCQNHDKDCLFAEFPPKNSSQLRSVSLPKSFLFQKPKVWHLLELSNNKLKPWCRTGYLNLGCHSQIPMGCDAKCKQTDSQ